MQLFTDDTNIIKFDLQDAEIVLYQFVFTNQESDYYLEKLKNNIEWKQDKINIYGKEVDLPRLTAWYGDSNTNYKFSGISLNPKIWTDELIKIKYQVEKIVNIEFNSVLLNFYRNGRDSISWHTDAEPELGKDPIIASLTFGETRIFQLKHRFNKNLKIVSIPLTNGSLLLMKGSTQHFWLHQIPKTDKPLKTRINLTFRIIK